MDVAALARLSKRQLDYSINNKVVDKLVAESSHSQADFIGQDRAREALEFGLGLDFPGYNIYVMGEPALGRHTLITRYVKQKAQQKPTPSSWCYLNNFEDTRQPNILKLAVGDGKLFHQDISSLIDELFDTFPAAFDNPGYQRKKRAINKVFENKYEAALREVEVIAQNQSIAMFEDTGTVSFSPIVDGNIIDDADFPKLTEGQQEFFYSAIESLESVLNEGLLELPGWKRELSEQLRELQRDTIESAIKPLLKELEHKYSYQLGILKYIRDMRPHLIDTVADWLVDEGEEKHEDIDRKSIFTEQFQPNVFIEHEEKTGVPIIFESNPTYQNVFGRIEYSGLQGVLLTNHQMIREGALHRANGGYLILEAEKMLQQPNVWDALKRALKQKKVYMDPPQTDSTLSNSMTLLPQAMPLDVKVVLMGSRDLYYFMQDHDDEFSEWFRVLADFESYFPKDEIYLRQFVGQIKTFAQEVIGKDLTREAIKSLIKFSHRQAEHQSKLSARIADIHELIQEASFFSKELELQADDVKSALEARKRRTGQLSELLQEDIEEGQILIDTKGEAIGKTNGLTVLEIGENVFGTPARISATVHAGTSGIIDIEREVDLGKSIHSKGVLLLSGYLGHQYAQEFPLTLSANIAIEQSYGHIDGDSASLAELVALISAITLVPVRQDLAVTGSINQHGQVQSVGGVNEKIEGFFSLCKSRGLTGEQGVIIPKTNLVNLVLDDEVILAVSKKRFHVYCVENVDQALELLLNQPVGEKSKKGIYPKQSIHYKAFSKLKSIADVVAGDAGES
ncbi:Lon protease family protein [Algicola sagamiensis]|uniref:Lon protease family protein n=1 Tax=Algicola sagamiensis TaxID=163869 RepID=UPI0003683E6D|nr:ATP-binding protein [Algicola sagamiensis]